MDFTRATARLLSEPLLRAAFRDAPQRVAAALCTGSAAERLASLEPDQLEAQARVLVEKRFAAVRSIVPASSRTTRALFDDYSGEFWPQGHRRHQRDALAFLGHLRRAGARVCAREFNRLMISERGARIRMAAGWVHTRAGWRLGLHVAARGGRREWLFYLG